MAANPIIVAERCHYCSKPRSPRDIIHLPGGKLMCVRCYQWHQHAMRLLATGEPPPGCQECGRSFESLKPVNERGDMRMYLHPKDGVYQVLCRQCSDAYVRKRVDLFRSTKFGHEQRLT